MKGSGGASKVMRQLPGSIGGSWEAERGLLAESPRLQGDPPQSRQGLGGLHNISHISVII